MYRAEMATIARPALVAEPDTQLTDYCFTYHYGKTGQPALDVVQLFIDALKPRSTYLIFGYELGDEGNTPHLQGYVELAKRARKTELKKLPFGWTVHWEGRRGTQDAAIEYCKKDKAFEEFGEPREDPGERERNRWKRARVLAAAGDFNAIDDQIYICYLSNLRRIREEAAAPPRDLNPGTRMKWYYGPSRTGKSRQARVELGPPEDWYFKNLNKWWCNYKDGNAVLIDDLGPEVGKALVNHVKQWFDIYAFGAEIKGGSRYIRPPMIYITSNYHPAEIWGGTPDYEPIMNRVDLRYFPRAGEAPPEYDVAGRLICLLTPVPLTRQQAVCPGAPKVVPETPCNDVRPLTVPPTPQPIDLTNEEEDEEEEEILYLRNNPPDYTPVFPNDKTSGGM